MTDATKATTHKLIDFSPFSAPEHFSRYPSIYVPSGPFSAIIPLNDRVRNWLARQPNPSEPLGGTRLLFDDDESAIRFARLRWTTQLSIAFCLRIALQPPTTEVVWEFDGKYYRTSRISAGHPVYLDVRRQAEPSVADIITAVHGADAVSARMSSGG